jgi:hypothetical protein
LALWSDQTPNGGGSEVDLIVWASQRAFLTLLTDVGDIGEHPLFNSNLHEGGQTCANQLDYFQISDRVEMYDREFLPKNVHRGGTLM